MLRKYFGADERDRRLNHILVVLLALGFAALVAAAIATVWLQRLDTQNSQWVEHTLDVQTTAAELSRQHERVETARRGFLLRGHESFRAIMNEAAEPLPGLVDRLVEMTADNDAQQQRLARIRALLAREAELRDAMFAAVNAGQRSEIMDGFERDVSVQTMRQTRALLDEVEAAEHVLLRERNAVQSATLNRFYVVLAITGLLLLVVAVITVTILLRNTETIRRSTEELRRLNLDLEGVVSERTVDLQRANDEIQRFAYIVSHDLRSPLVNVMGFTAELDAARATVHQYFETLREDGVDVAEPARLAIEEDLPEALGFIRTSTKKMDRLINAILRLSREGRRTLTPEQLDMTVLVQGIADTLYQRASDADAEIAIETLPPLVSDRVAIEQILSNLIENAVKYVKPGRPGRVVVRGYHERDRLVYEIEDNGRGIDPRDHERVFDLFRRSGAQDKPGEGIGLAHVRALAYRLGGIISVQSELDAGATFRLSVPHTMQETRT